MPEIEKSARVTLERKKCKSFRASPTTQSQASQLSGKVKHHCDKMELRQKSTAGAKAFFARKNGSLFFVAIFPKGMAL
jgi:hypothetical protein